MLDSRTVLLQGRHDEHFAIFDTNLQYDPLQYVILFPRDELGWSFGEYDLQTPKNAVPDEDEVEDGFAEAGVADDESDDDEQS
ncbi:hypothetical protein EC968_000731, partial [Mortierella alpina]